MAAYTETNKPGNIGDKPTIDAIGIRWMADEHADVSYLEKEPGEDYYEEGMARLDAFHRGDWEMTGVRAYARVSYPVNGNGDRHLDYFTSSGLWGIESDSDEEYKRHEEIAQLRELKEHLETFGVDTSNFWQVARISDEHKRQYEEYVVACVKPAPVIEW